MEANKIKQESKIQVMRIAHRLRFSIDIGSSGRTWLKAGSVYIWSYIIPSLDPNHQTDETLLKLVEHLLQYFHQFYKKNRTAVSNKIPLPTRKVFLSFARLRRRLKSYTRSQLVFEDFVGRNPSTSSTTTQPSWSKNPYLLIGYLRFKKLDDDEECLVLCDGCGDYLLCSFHSSTSPFINSVVLLALWSFIPSLTHHVKPGYIEILEDPIILSSFNTTTLSQSNHISATLRSELLNKLNADNTQVSCDGTTDLYFGRIQEVISHEIGIFTLASQYIIMCTDIATSSLQSSLGIRRGCVVTVKVDQVLPHPYKSDQTILITNEPPQVICHSDTTASWNPFITPSTGIPITQLRHTKPHRCLETWNLASDMSSLCTGGCSSTLTESTLDRSLSSVCFNTLLQNSIRGEVEGVKVGKFYDTFDRLLLNNIRDKALQLAKDRLPRPPTPEYWSFSTVSYNDIYPFPRQPDQAVLLVGLLHTECATGQLMIKDVSGSIPCMLIPGEFNSKPVVHRQMTPPCTEGLNKIVSIRNFLVTVERRWDKKRSTVVLNNQQTAGDLIEQVNDTDPYQYDVYIVAFASDLTVLCKHNTDSMTCDFNPIFNRFMTSQHTGNSTMESTTLSTSSNVSMLQSDCVVFVLSNTEASQHYNHHQSNFNLICWKVRTSGLHLSEFVLTMKGNARRWRSVLQPGALVHVTNAVFSSLLHDEKVYQVEECDVTHLHGDDVIVGEEMLEKINHKWARSKWNDNMRHMYTVDEIHNLTSNKNNLNMINIYGVIQNRSTFADGFYGKIKTRVELSSGRKTHCIYLDTLPLPSRGGMSLIPGCTVAFYRLKACVSKMGHVYTKYTQNSHHAVVGVDIPRPDCPVPNTIVVSDDANVDDNDYGEVPEVLLYNLNLQASRAQLTKIRVALLKIVDVKIRLKSSTSWKGAEGEVLFTAKCVVHDHSGRAVVHFDETKLADFRRLARIKDEAWHEVVSLLQLVTDRGVEFTFFGTEPPFYGGVGVDASVKTILYQMFACMNDVCLGVCVMLTMRRDITSSVVGVGGKHMDFMKSFHESYPMCKIEATSYNDDDIPSYGLSVYPLELSCVRVLTQV